MTNEDKSVSKKWWWDKRCKYNKGLIIAGFIAFMFYCILGPIIITPHEEFEETIFTMFFQGIVYLVIVGVANFFYTLGWVVDVLYNRGNNQRFRERLFALGYWFSFAPPILLVLSAMAVFLIWGH